MIETYPWASNQEELAAFMKVVVRTLDDTKIGSDWNYQGACAVASWQAIGGKGRPTLKALRALK
jgi:hypothetical protein